MDTAYPSSRQWTIRQYPWIILLILIAIGVPLLGAIIVNPDVRCGGIILLPVLVAVGVALGEVVTCQLDLDTRTVTLRRASLVRRTQQQFAFDDIQTVSVQRSSDGEATTYRVVFTLKSGENIPLTGTTSSGKGGKDKLARQISAYINQARLNPISPALDGVVRIENQGETNGVRWQIAFVTANDNVPLTRWHSPQARFTGGFILLMPAMGAKTSAMPGGLAGSLARMAYGQYLRMLDLSEQDMPGFAEAQLLPGDQVGLEQGFAILTSDPAAAKAWLTPARVGQLTAWTQSNPLQANRAASDPHLWVTAQGLWLALRGKYNRPEQVAAIAQLGAGLVKA